MGHLLLLLSEGARINIAASMRGASLHMSLPGGLSTAMKSRAPAHIYVKLITYRTFDGRRAPPPGTHTLAHGSALRTVTAAGERGWVRALAANARVLACTCVYSERTRVLNILIYCMLYTVYVAGPLTRACLPSSDSRTNSANERGGPNVHRTSGVCPCLSVLPKAVPLRP